MNKPAIKERVSVKMVAKKQDGTVVKKLFKPIGNYEFIFFYYT